MENNGNFMNRAQRRQREKAQRLQMKRIQKYLREHPEAMKVELDEDAIKEAGINEKDSVIVGGDFLGTDEKIVNNENKKDDGNNIAHLIGKSGNKEE